MSENAPLRLGVVIDYQNVHLVAADLFMPSRPVQESLIDPYRFACQLALARSSTNKQDDRVAEIARVEVFRGQPILEDDPVTHQRNLEQAQRWIHGHATTVGVNLHPLTYDWDYRGDRMVPIRQTRREKGVDVLCALTLVDMARSGLYDVVVLASWDRDLAPALDHADRASRTKVEAAKWHSPSQPDSDGFLRTTRRLWTTPMTKKHFQASLDPRSIDDLQLHPATRRDMVS